MTFKQSGNRISAGKIIGVCCLLCTMVIFAACDMFTDNVVEYIFENKTDYTVYVTLNQSYQETKYGEDTKSKEFYVYRGETKSVFISSSSVSFEFTASGYTGDNEIYSETSGTSAVFKTRKISGYYKYEFDNQTDYSIYITLNQPYKTSLEDSDEKPATDRLYVYSKSSQSAYLYLKNSVDFEWTCSYSDDNSKVYSETKGSKVTFKEN